MKHVARPLPPEAVRLLQPFFPDFDLQRIRVCEGIPRYILGDALGYAEGDTIYLQRGAYQPETIHGLALLAHEIAHCQQYDKHGAWWFRLRYLYEYFKYRQRGMNHATAYWRISFEVQARAVEDLVAETLQNSEDLALPLALVNPDALEPFIP